MIESKNKNLYTVNEIASMYSINKETVRRWLRSGKLKGKFINKKEGYLIKEKDLQKFMTDFSKYDLPSSEALNKRNYLIRKKSALEKQLEITVNKVNEIKKELKIIDNWLNSLEIGSE